MPQFYQASYTINGGCTGLGGNYPDEDASTHPFQVPTDEEALQIASSYAHFLAMERLLNPMTGKTVVTLVSLTRPDGTVVNQVDQVRSASRIKNMPEDQLEAMIRQQLPEGRLVTEVTFADHLMYDLFKPDYIRLGFLKAEVA